MATNQISDGRLVRVAPDKRHRQIELLLGQRDGKVGEGVEGDGNLVAVRTRQFRLILTREEIDDLRVMIHGSMLRWLLLVGWLVG